MELKTNERVLLTVVPRALDGTEVVLDGPVSFAAVPEGYVSIVRVNDKSAWVKGEVPGTTEIHISADADLDGHETRFVQAFVLIDVLRMQQEASTLEVDVGTPEVVG